VVGVAAGVGIYSLKILDAQGVGEWRAESLSVELVQYNIA
jgi:hypothetical protein